MTSSGLLILVPVLVGVAVALQAPFLAYMSRQAGPLENTFVTYGGGGLVMAVVMLMLRGGNLGALAQAPWYVFTTGITGAFVVGGIGFAAARVGQVATFTLIVAAQFIVSAFIDHFGLLGATMRVMDPVRALGIGLLLVGVWLIVR